MIPAVTGKLVVFQGAGQAFQLQSAEVRALLPGEILVKNRYTTLCGSDLHTFCGLRKEICPTVLGHEIVGEVMAIHSAHSGFDHNGKQLGAGDLITWSIFSSDPQSYHALQGMPQKGDHLFKYGHAKVENTEVFHGGLAEYCILKAHTAILKLPDEIPLPIAATLNCAIATVAGALRIAGNLKGKNVMITGMGLLGMTCAAMCKDAGAAWIVAGDISSKRLEEAKYFGADETINHTKPGKEIDIVFDMSGSPDAMEFGIDCLAIGGSAILIGAVFNTRKIQVDAEKVIRKLLTIKGLHNYNYQDFSYALDFLTRNWAQYPFDQVVGKEFSLNEVQEAFEYAVKFKPLRVGIRI